MKNIKLKIVCLLVLVFISVMFTQCKSVELTFLGFINIPKKTSLPISGTVYNSIGNPVINIDIYIVKKNTIKYHGITNMYGHYTINNVKSGTYDFYLISSYSEKHIVFINNIISENKRTELNFNF